MTATPDLDARLLATLADMASEPETVDLARDLIDRHYGLEGALSLLTGERDSNFRFLSSSGDFVFKIFGAASVADEPDLLCSVLRFLAVRAPEIAVPRLMPTQGGQDFVRFVDRQGRARFAVLYSFLPGKPLIDVARTPEHWRGCATMLARLGIALRDFSHPFMLRPLIWDLRHLPVLRTLLGTMRETPFEHFVVPFLDAFADSVARPLASVPHQFVHNDLNARNVIVDNANPAKIAGIIDFGDAIHTARLCDVAVGVIGQLATAESAEAAMAQFVDSYESISPLTALERQLLPWMVAGRIVQNVVITAYYRESEGPGGHFSTFGSDYFGWRIAFAERLVAPVTADR